MALSKTDTKTIIKVVSIILAGITAMVGWIAYVEAKYSSNVRVDYVEQKTVDNKNELQFVKDDMKTDIREIRIKLDNINNYILTREK